MVPPDLQIDLVANQPRMVEERISSFMREFGIAIVAVIMVTMLLLPFRWRWWRRWRFRSRFRSRSH